MLNNSECHRVAHERLREKQELANREHEMRIQLVLSEIPRLKDIKDELAKNMRDFTQFAFSGDRSDEKFKEYKAKSLALQQERKELLKKYGYPERIRTNYAKNRPDFVFKINQKLEKYGLSKEGATLSFQSLNPDTLASIGRKNMSLLEKIIFIADFISAERDYNGVEIMRKKAIESLDEAIVEGLSFTIKDLIDAERLIHPDTLDAYNDALFIIQQEKSK